MDYSANNERSNRSILVSYLSPSSSPFFTAWTIFLATFFAPFFWAGVAGLSVSVGLSLPVVLSVLVALSVSVKEHDGVVNVGAPAPGHDL